MPNLLASHHPASKLTNRWAGLWLTAAFTTGALGLAADSRAQPSATPPTAITPNNITTVEKITVTAEKRETDPEKTATAITAFSSDDLENRGIEGTRDLQFAVPNLTYGVMFADTQISLRGVGNENITPGGDPGVALHVDGVYLGRSSAALTDYLDLERIEVLRGPQGTLYGRNATGGSINLITHKPTDDLHGRLDALGGDYGRTELSGAVGGTLRDQRLFARASAVTQDREGYHQNLFDGRKLEDTDQRAARLHLELDPSDRVELLLSVHRHDEGGSGAVAKNLGDRIPDLRRSARDFPQAQDNQYDGITLTTTWVGSDFELTSVSSSQDLSTDYAFDGDATPLPLQTITSLLDAQQLSQELRVQSTSGGRLNWLVGLYWLDEELVSDFDLRDAFIGTYNLDATVETDSRGLFGQVSHALTDRLNWSAGVRYTDDEKRAVDRQFLPAFGINFAIPQQKDWQEVTGHLGLDLELSDRSFLYAKVSRGYKSGGFNLPGDGLGYDPEILVSYEVGSKSRLAGDRVTLGATLFHYDYQDMQVFQVRNFQTLIENAAESTIDGVEVELKARPIAGVQLSASAGYLDAEYNSFLSLDPLNPFAGLHDLRGNRLNRAPKLSYDFGIQKSFHLGDRIGYLTPRIDTSWQDEMFFRQFNLPAESQGSFQRTSVRVTWDSAGGRWNAQGFVDNLEDEDVIGNVLVSQAALSAVLFPPRTWGARFGYRF